ncbi:hypothetical protein [Amycolatopsis samaneae]|uniref:Uncharacterized protein n=1 Tax=Amycolatopsis samaneae TaxID=664691 RepID=A0ABW5GIC6_9PSEU
MADRVEPLLDLRLWHPVVALGCQIDQVLLLSVEVAQFGGELLVEETAGSLLVLERRRDVRPDTGDEVEAEPDGGVVSLDGFLDVQDVEVRSATGAALLVSAEEVHVLGATGVDRALDDHPA